MAKKKKLSELKVFPIPDGMNHRSRPYNVWSLMKRRCDKIKCKQFPHYGGRGISYCNRWKSFSNFWEDMKGTFQPNLTLDRIDNDGNYEPSNCRWVTMKEQCNNRRSSRLITIGMDTKTLAQWIELSGIKKSTVSMRLSRGLSPRMALGIIGGSHS
jgi:hypothetical protein